MLDLTVSLGPPPVDVPATLVGKPLTDATAELAAAGLTVGEVTHQFDEKVAANSVIALAPGVGAQAPKGSGIPLVVSDGPAPRTVPAGLVGLTQDQATAKLKEVGLKATATPTPSETVPAGQVMDVEPGPGQPSGPGLHGHPHRLQRPADGDGARRVQAVRVRRRQHAPGGRAHRERHAGQPARHGEGHQPGGR